MQCTKTLPNVLPQVIPIFEVGSYHKSMKTGHLDNAY